MQKLKKPKERTDSEYDFEIEAFAECELPVLLGEIGTPPEYVLEKFKDIADWGIDWSDRGILRSDIWSFTFNHEKFSLFKNLQGHAPVEIAWLIYNVTATHPTLRMNFIKRALNL
jgi:hypothetical protein